MVSLWKFLSLTGRGNSKNPSLSVFLASQWFSSNERHSLISFTVIYYNQPDTEQDAGETLVNKVDTLLLWCNLWLENIEIICTEKSCRSTAMVFLTWKFILFSTISNFYIAEREKIKFFEQWTTELRERQHVGSTVLRSSEAVTFPNL